MSSNKMWEMIEMLIDNQQKLIDYVATLHDKIENLEELEKNRKKPRCPKCNKRGFYYRLNVQNTNVGSSVKHMCFWCRWDFIEKSPYKPKKISMEKAIKKIKR
ncbi:hypothetical protein HQ529_03495 [Candidatus Woesearchaeota archaeon]|nr:hypothetical protein [Candidatus Woesearchaeota archaeon]